MKVIPKMFYFLQAIEPVRYWQNRFISAFRKFIGAGSSCIPLSILEWGKDRGGLGLLSILHKSRSLRFNTLKIFLNRTDLTVMTPINSILAYYLDIPIICRYRPTLVRTGQLCYGGNRKLIDRQNMRKTYFQFFLEDVAWFTRMEGKYPGLDNFSTKDYYKLIVDFSAEFIRETHRGLVKIEELNLPRDEEKTVWKNVFLNSLGTREQSFNLKVVHGALPTLDVIGGNSVDLQSKFCYYCKHKLGIDIIENSEHVLLQCVIAKSVWHCINERLKAAFLDTLVVNKDTVFYKIGVAKPQSHLISEVSWFLWKNRCINLYDKELNSHISVLKKLFHHLKMLSSVDKSILTVKGYNARWLGLNQAIDALEC